MAKPSIAAAREAVELLGSYPPGAVILGFFSMPSGTHVAVVHDSAQVWEQPPLRVVEDGRRSHDTPPRAKTRAALARGAATP